VNSVVFSPDGTKIVSGSDETVNIWNAANGDLEKTLTCKKAPIESAAEGTIKGSWVRKRVKNGVPRWVPDVSTELNGFRRLTVDYCAKHIGKPITLYVREYKEMWPTANAWSKPSDSTYWTAKFVPNGDAVSGKTKIDGWLKSRKPEIKKGAHFYVDGSVDMCHKDKCDDSFPDGVQVDSNGKKLMSLNFMNQEVFVKV
jgi:WD40 repeat protein